LFGTLRGQAAKVRGNVVLGFAVLALVVFVITSLATVVNAPPSIRRVTHFTLFSAGLDQLMLVGFFGMAATAALYFIVPRLIGHDWPSALLARVHLLCAGVAVLLVAIAFLAGGVIHGMALDDSQTAFVVVMKRYIPFASVGTLANLLLLAGACAFAVNLLLALLAAFRFACLPAVKAAMEPVPTEVRA
jgi:cytochrome c oxidase cbb3-type subunit 1